MKLRWALPALLLSGPAHAADIEPVALPEPPALSQDRARLEAMFERMGFRFGDVGFICPKGFYGGSNVGEGLCEDADGARVRSRPRQSGERGSQSVDIIGPADAVTEVLVQFNFIAGDEPGWLATAAEMILVARKLSGSEAYDSWIPKAVTAVLEGKTPTHRHGLRTMSLRKVDARELGFIVVFLSFQSVRPPEHEQAVEQALDTARGRMHWARAETARDDGKWSEAAKHYAAAARRRVRHEDAVRAQAAMEIEVFQAAVAKESWGTAESAFRDALETHTRTVHQLIASDASRADDLRRLIDQLLRRDPETALKWATSMPEWDADQRRAAALAVAHSDCTDRSLTLYSEVLAARPDPIVATDSAACSAALGSAALQRGDVETAEAFRDGGLQVAPDSDAIRALSRDIRNEGRLLEPTAALALGGLAAGVGLAVPSVIYWGKASTIHDELLETPHTTAEVDRLILEGQQAQRTANICAITGVGLALGAYGAAGVMAKSTSLRPRITPVLGTHTGAQLDVRF